MNRSSVRIVLWLLLALVLGLAALAADGQGLPDAPHRQRGRDPLQTDRLETSLLVADAFSRGLDCYSTRRMLSRGDREMSLPMFIAGHSVTMAAFSGAMVAANYLTARQLESHRHRKLARIVTAVDLGQDLPWAIHNLFLKPAIGNKNSLTTAPSRHHNWPE